MSYLALARKWRPKNFSEVVGQAHVVSALVNALDSQKVHHAFLFSGTRGVGKTTLARIFAKALNCKNGVSANPCGECVACLGVDQGNFIDLIEVDAASRTRVDDTRELLDNVQYTPTQGSHKIYLIDEVHMLSTHSFNALLKTLEEPPEHVKFLLATTNPQKLPTTILSRCIQFNLKAVGIDDISAQLEKILIAEKVDYEMPALKILARSANGSVRDALSLLDQSIAFTRGNVLSDEVRSMLGMIDTKYIANLLENILKGDAQSALQVVEVIAQRAADYKSALDDLLVLIHNIALAQLSASAVESKAIEVAEIVRIGQSTDAETLQLMYQIGAMGKKDFDYAPDPRTGFEMVVMRMLAFLPEPQDAASAVQSTPRNVDSAAQARSQNLTAAPNSKVENRAGEIAQAAPKKAADAVIDPPQIGRVPTLSELIHPQCWSEFIGQTGLTGMSKEILMNMSPREARGDTLIVALEPSSRSLLNPARKQKIEQHCYERLGLTLILEVATADMPASVPDTESPQQKLGREKVELENQTEKAFTEDPNVKEIIELFDAKIVPDSIQSGS